ncbi:hypothetical protein ABZT03_26525 [Streptomyces sp. NPDC005574]|uniref:hypothetical protein n=1 Tax=Streptomyces sp. NPDC005574 TaxID=3156891 RepID=UPI0033B83550
MTVVVPRSTARYRDYTGIEVFSGESIVLPPSTLPSDAKWAGATFRLISDSEPSTVRGVLDDIGRIAPTVSLIPQGSTSTDCSRSP